MTVELAGLFNDGVLIDLNVSCYRARQRLKAAEVEANEQKTKLDIIHLGHKSLFAEETMRPLRKAEAKARKALGLYSVPFPLSGIHFVPKKALGDLRFDLVEAQGEFNDAVQAFLARYEANRDEMLAKYGPSGTAKPGILKPEDYPAKEDLRFGMSWRIFTLSTVDEGGNEFKEAMQEFIRDTVATLREKVAETCAEQAKRITEGKPVSEQQMDKLKKMIDDFQRLDFVGDAVVAGSLEELRKTLNIRSAKEVREDPFAQADLKNALNAVKASAENTKDYDEIVGRYGRVIQVGPATETPTEPAPPVTEPEPAQAPQPAA